MADVKYNDAIDVRILVRKIWSRRKFFFFKVWPITFVLSCLYIICIPRYYTSDAILAPELGSSASGGTLGSLASSFGIDLTSMENSDAIGPMLYPNLMEDNGFAMSLFSIRVKSADGEIDTDYYTYLKDYQKFPWWGYVIKGISDGIKSLLPKKDLPSPGSIGGEKSPYWLSEEENGKLEVIRSNVNISINEKAGTLTIQTKAQDPLVAKILADSVQVHLQEFITKYRTNKARIDVAHYEELVERTYQEYEQKCKEYSKYSEKNMNIVMTSFQTEVENLQREKELKYTAYTSLSGQLEAAKAKLQERTPAFTQLKGASVALKPAGPKRMLFVLFMLVLVTAITIVVTLRE